MAIDLVLTQEQRKHFDSIAWLLYGPYRSGRTRILAVVFVKYALTHQGEKVDVFDHIKPGSKQTQRVIFSEIHKIIKVDENLDFDFFYLTGQIRFNGPKNESYPVRNKAGNILI